MAYSAFWLSYVLVHLLATGLAVGLAGYVYRGSWRKPIGKVFTAMAISFAVWTFFSLVRTFTADPTWYVALTTLKYVGVTTAPVTLFLFGLIYADGEHYVTRRTVGGLLVIPVVTLVVLATTLETGLFYAAFDATTVAGMTVLETTRGGWFWGFAIFGWGLLALGSFLLVYGGYRLPWLYRTHVVIIVLGISVPWGASIGYIVSDWPHAAVDPTPIGFAVASLLWAIGVFGTDLVDVSPVARSRVVSAIGDPVIVLDDDDRVVDCNDAAGPLLGNSRPFGEPATDALPDALATVVGPDAVGSTTRQELVEIDLGGTTRYYQCGVLPLGPDGDFGTVVILSDVTELTSVKRELEARNRELQRQNDRLDEFASMVSHDLRNPLMVAKGNLELLAEEVDSEMVDHVDQSLARMEYLIDDLLTLARQGQTVGDTDEVDLAALATEAWDGVPTGAAALELEGDLGTLEADSDRLQEALENLFRNAVEHADRGVTVRLGRLEGDGGFYVADDGPGIPEAAREQVFDHGYTTNDDGTGFGLTIVQTIVEAHGWSIRATESEAGGARFDIRTGPTTPEAVADGEAPEIAS